MVLLLWFGIVVMFVWIVAWIADLLECTVTPGCVWLVYVAFVLCCGWLLGFCRS